MANIVRQDVRDDSFSVALHKIEADERSHETQEGLASSARINIRLVLNWFPQTRMRGVVVATPLAVRFPTTPQTAI
jgi:hypothetical protein